MRSYFIAFCSFVLAAASVPADMPGSEDHPLITRFPGSEIVAYAVHDFGEFRIPLGPVTGYREIGEWTDTIEGKVTRIFYHLNAGDRSILEVHRNFSNALERGGFEILAEGAEAERNVSKDIGGRTFLDVVYRENNLSAEGAPINLLDGTATVGGSGYVAGHLQRSQGDVYVSVATTAYSKQQITIMLDVIEVAPMEDGLVFVDAEAMSKGIVADGKIALYGICFDFDKATLKPESKPTLDEIAKLMETRPNLSVYIVGHTDMSGSLDYNLNLSEQRAGAVVEALANDYGIARERLTAKGVGPLAPVATNMNDQGKSQNRRVELVAR